MTDYLPASLRTDPLPPSGVPPRTSWDLMVSGKAPLVYMPESAYERPSVTAALRAMYAEPRRMADPHAWEDLLAAAGTMATVYVFDRHGERYRVTDVAFYPGSEEGDLVATHMGRRGVVRIDLQRAFGYMLPVVAYKPTRLNPPSKRAKAARAKELRALAKVGGVGYRHRGAKCPQCSTPMLTGEREALAGQIQDRLCSDCSGETAWFLTHVPGEIRGPAELQQWIDADEAGRRTMTEADDARRARELAAGRPPRRRNPRERHLLPANPLSVDCPQCGALVDAPCDWLSSASKKGSLGRGLFHAKRVVVARGGVVRRRRQNPRGDDELRRLERLSEHDPQAAAQYLHALASTEHGVRDWVRRLNDTAGLLNTVGIRHNEFVTLIEDVASGRVETGTPPDGRETMTAIVQGHEGDTRYSNYPWRAVAHLTAPPMNGHWGRFDGEPLLSVAFGTAWGTTIEPGVVLRYRHVHGQTGALADRWSGPHPHRGSQSFATPVRVALAWARSQMSGE